MGRSIAQTRRTQGGYEEFAPTISGQIRRIFAGWSRIFGGGNDPEAEGYYQACKGRQEARGETISITVVII